MILTLDTGNSNIKIGIYDGDARIQYARLATDMRKTSDEYGLQIEGIFQYAGLSRRQVDGVIISSVVPPVTRALQGAARLLTGREPLVVGENVRCRIPVMIRHPETLGADLLTAAVGALDLYRPPLLLIDMGTATTISVLDAQGAFRGGAILPGANLALSALAGGTALLPDIPLAVPEKAIGTDTLGCMQSGCVLGSALLLDGMIDRMESELGCRTTVVATGGIAPVIAPACRHEMHMAADLILRGLAVLYEQNK